MIKHFSNQENSLAAITIIFGQLQAIIELQGQSESLRISIYNTFTAETFNLLLTSQVISSKEDLKIMFSNALGIFYYLRDNPTKLIVNQHGQMMVSVQIVGAKGLPRVIVLKAVKQQENQVKIMQRKQRRIKEKYLQILRQINQENSSIKVELNTLKQQLQMLDHTFTQNIQNVENLIRQKDSLFQNNLEQIKSHYDIVRQKRRQYSAKKNEQFTMRQVYQFHPTRKQLTMQCERLIQKKVSSIYLFVQQSIRSSQIKFEQKINNLTNQLHKKASQSQQSQHKLIKQRQDIQTLLNTFNQKIQDKLKQALNNWQASDKQLRLKLQQPLSRLYVHNQINYQQILSQNSIFIKRYSEDKCWKSYIHRYEIKPSTRCSALFKIVQSPHNNITVGICASSYLGKHAFKSSDILSYYGSGGYLLEYGASKIIGNGYTANDMIEAKLDLRQNVNTVQWIKNGERVQMSTLSYTFHNQTLYFSVLTYNISDQIEITIKW